MPNILLKMSYVLCSLVFLSFFFFLWRKVSGVFFIFFWIWDATSTVVDCCLLLYYWNTQLLPGQMHHSSRKHMCIAWTKQINPIYEPNNMLQFMVNVSYVALRIQGKSGSTTDQSAISFAQCMTSVTQVNTGMTSVFIVPTQLTSAFCLFDRKTVDIRRARMQDWAEWIEVGWPSCAVMLRRSGRQLLPNLGLCFKRNIDFRSAAADL